MCDLYQGEEAESGPRQGMDVIVDELIVAYTNMRIYWKSHPRVRTSVQTIRAMLQQLMRRRQVRNLVLGVAEGCLFFDREPLLGASVAAGRVIRSLESLGTGGLYFEDVLEDHDVDVLVQVLGDPSLDLRGHEDGNAALEANGCRAIRFLPAYQADGIVLPGVAGEEPVELQGSALAEELEAPVHLYKNTVELMQESLIAASQHETFELHPAQDMVGNLLGRLRQDAASMRRLARYERYDSYTFGHSIRVCTLALSFASQLTDDRELVLRIGTAGLLHDIGKAWVPFEVLHSSGRLNPEERLEMNKHAEHGAQILLSLPEADPLVVAVAFGHHRTQDGGGYPEHGIRTQQSVGTRIVKICDVYEALTAVRPYKAPMTPQKAYQVMMAMKNHFDPGLLRRFIETNGLFPVGSDVAIADGIPARVVAQGASFHRPVVRMIDTEGNFTADAPIDLGTTPLAVEVGTSLAA